MTLVEKIIELTISLRCLKIDPYNSNTYFNKAAIEVFKNLFEGTNTRKASLFLYSKNGKKLEEMPIEGVLDSWENIDSSPSDWIIRPYLSISNSDKSYSYIFKIKTYGLYNGYEATIGFLRFSSMKDFTEVEVGLVEIFLDVFADYCKKIMTVTFNLDADILLNSDYDQTDKKPGTILLRYLNALHKKINSFTSLFCIIDKRTLATEYYKKSRREGGGGVHLQSEKKIKEEINDVFHNTINKKDFFIWRSHPKYDSLYSMISKIDEDIQSDHKYLISVIKNDSVPICLWIFGFNKNQFILKSEIEVLIKRINEKIGPNFNYLYQRRSKNMIINPIFRSRDTRIEKNTVFVLMPFTLEWSDRIWDKIIKPTIATLGLKSIRADDLFGADIMEDVWKGILNSEIILADITDRNPNVFYELGIAHTLGKKVILITQDVNDIPFDLNRFRHIVYQDNFDGYEVLIKQLKAVINDILNR